MARCKARKANGMMCKNQAVEGSDVCARHNMSASRSASFVPSDILEAIDEMGDDSISMSIPAPPPSICDSLALEKLAEMSHKISVLETLLKTLLMNPHVVATAAAATAVDPTTVDPTVATRPKKHRNMTDAGVRRKAKFIFYNEYKSNPALLDTLTTRLGTAGLLRYRKKGDVDVLDVPWTLIKQCTDAEFDNMSDEDKMIWYGKVVRPS